MLSNQHYLHRANQKLRSWANPVFQNHGVCRQAVPSFPFPSPVIFFFFCSCPSFLDKPREETLATQAMKAMICTLSYKFNSWKQTDTLSYENLIYEFSLHCSPCNSFSADEESTIGKKFHYLCIYATTPQGNQCEKSHF